MADCIFCKIVSREIDAKRVYEDEHSLAFLDINPANRGHALVIPKTHAPTVFEMQEEALKNLSSAVRKVALGVKEAVSPQGMNIVQNNGKAAGQIVDHVHFHVIPRNFEDGNDLHFIRVDVSEEDQKKIAKRIRDAMPHTEEKKEDRIGTMLDNIDKSLNQLDDVLG